MKVELNTEIDVLASNSAQAAAAAGRQHERRAASASAAAEEKVLGFFQCRIWNDPDNIFFNNTQRVWENFGL